MKPITIAIWLNLAAFVAIFSFSILVYSNDTPTAASRMLAVLVYVTLFVLPIISVDVMRPMKLSYGLIESFTSIRVVWRNIINSNCSNGRGRFRLTLKL